MKKFIAEFKEFTMRGNVMDMAIGVIIGTAFGNIVSSLVNDMIMPVITLLTGAADFSDLAIVLKAPEMIDGQLSAGITLNYGSFIQNVIDFLIIAFVIFLMLKMMNKLISLRKKENQKEVSQKKGPTTGPTTEELLMEIRDLLKEYKN